MAKKAEAHGLYISGFARKVELSSTFLIYDLAGSSRNQHKHRQSNGTDRPRMASPFSLYTGPHWITSPASSPPLVAFRKAQYKNIASFDYPPRGRGDARDTGRRRGRLSLARGWVGGGQGARGPAVGPSPFAYSRRSPGMASYGPGGSSIVHLPAPTGAWV